MGKGFSSNDFLLGSDDSVNGYPYADAFGNPDDIIEPDWLTSFFSTDFDLEPGFATAIVLGDGFNPKLHLYDSTGFTYFKINNPNVDDDAFGGTDSQSVFYASPGSTYDAVVESVDFFPAGDSRNFYFEVQVDGAGNDQFSAQDLGDLSTTTYAFADDFVGVSDADDYFRFDLSQPETVEITLGGLQSDVDLQLLDASGNFVDGSFNADTNAELITATLSPGTYYVQATAYNAFDQARAIASNDVASNYFLDLYTQGSPPPVNQAPTDILLLNGSKPVNSIAENQPAGTVLGNLATIDPDDPDQTGTYVYSLVSGTDSNDNSKFTLSSTGVLSANQQFDYEATQKSYTILVQTQDAGGLFTEKAFTIGVRDVNDENGTTVIVEPPLPPVVPPTNPNPTDSSIIGTRKNDRLTGTSQDDLIRGLKGNDKLNGKAGNDILVGGAGNDLLKGGAGDDVFRGGQGNDICVLNGGFDTVQGFTSGQDKLKLIGGASFGSLTITQQGSDTLISAGGDPLALIVGTNSSQITAASFV
ncbi:MAG: pre-peptidase C-terminal domain-containing protein [Pegethrix bostrychoides GSE-TBD4-15B]|jgi:Ca2+-binding RTX toxin-like protein|uniref:Pre-peptidase C-terminal domain-containing protein n=1 Tax=Pegethrix bostrychoides GSE-TBD4-15B TaxID=2839662 RepID=A0A951PAW9_9CYAN|nr:pre-peptidase C-terminal domain-containing protein [Pegethrix bostrychoides GSE-TBD4-15B]